MLFNKQPRRISSQTSFLTRQIKEAIIETPPLELKHDYLIQNYPYKNVEDSINIALNSKLFTKGELSFYDDNIFSNIPLMVADAKYNKTFDKNIELTQFKEPINRDFIEDIFYNLIYHNKILLILTKHDIYIDRLTYKIYTPDVYYSNCAASATFVKQIEKNLLEVTTFEVNKFSEGINNVTNFYKQEDGVFELSESVDGYYQDSAAFELVLNTNDDLSDLQRIKELVLIHDYTLTTGFKEIGKTKTKIHTSEEFTPAYIQDSDLIQMYEIPARMDTTKPFFEIQQSNIRMEYQQIQEHYLTLLLQLCGLSLAALSIKNNNIQKTATQIESENAITIDTINKLKTKLQVILTDIFDTMLFTQTSVNLRSYSPFTKESLTDLSNKMTLSILDKITMQNPDITNPDILLKMAISYKIENAVELLPLEFDFALKNHLIDHNYTI